MADINNLRPGDMLLVADGTSLVARGIQEFMLQYCKINHYQYYRLYHHAALVVEDRGKIKIAEAIGRGWVIREPLEAYTAEEWIKRVDIYRLQQKLSAIELRKLNDLALDYSLKITRYDYANFIFQMIMIRTGVWLGPKEAKAEGRLYCSEGVATIYNKIRPSMCEEPWRYNPIDLFLEPGYFKV